MGGPIVYRLGHQPFKLKRRVRFPLGLPNVFSRRRVFRVRSSGAVFVCFLNCIGRCGLVSADTHPRDAGALSLAPEPPPFL